MRFSTTTSTFFYHLFQAIVKDKRIKYRDDFVQKTIVSDLENTPEVYGISQ